MTVVQPISDDDFETWPAGLKVIVHDHPRRYGCLRLRGGATVAIAWRSDRIEPVIVEEEESGVVWVGVDERVACVSPDGTTVFAVALGNYVLDIKVFSDRVVIVGEAVLLSVNRTYSIRSIVELEDLPVDIDVVADGLLVHYAGGRTKTVRA